MLRPALLGDFEHMPDLQPDFLQRAEIGVAIERRRRGDLLLEQNESGNLIYELIIEHSARVPGDELPLRVVARVRESDRNGRCRCRGPFHATIIYWEAAW